MIWPIISSLMWMANNNMINESVYSNVRASITTMKSSFVIICLSDHRSLPNDDTTLT